VLRCEIKIIEVYITDNIFKLASLVLIKFCYSFARPVPVTKILLDIITILNNKNTRCYQPCSFTRNEKLYQHFLKVVIPWLLFWPWFIKSYKNYSLKIFFKRMSKTNVSNNTSWKKMNLCFCVLCFLFCISLSLLQIEIRLLESKIKINLG
jgi:hypothetical protein